MLYNTTENNEELLKYAVDNGMINLSYVQEQIEMNRERHIEVYYLTAG